MTTALTWSDVRRAVNDLACERSDWAGYPVPIEGVKLTIERRHPLYARMNGMGFEVPDELDDPAIKIRNQWFSWRLQSTVTILEERGKLFKNVWPKAIGKITGIIRQFAVSSQAWDAEAELIAQDKLQSMVTEAAWKHYILLGMFLETSKRSNVTYVFRKSATTIAIGRDAKGELKGLAGLCLHPIGYYQETPCGVMVPTDDVIAHLSMMRGDEYGFWKKANHHRAWE